ncbi:hypothetical protein DP43_5013 [Burkholderia pseudomallei]|nr:hypothetical protein DP43_5013 [Burkholderia pseudomallei]
MSRIASASSGNHSSDIAEYLHAIRMPARGGERGRNPVGAGRAARGQRRGDHEPPLHAPLDPIEPAVHEMHRVAHVARERGRQRTEIRLAAARARVAHVEQQLRAARQRRRAVERPHARREIGRQVVRERAQQRARRAVPRIAEHAPHRPRLDHLALLDDGHRVAHRADHLHLVRDQHDREAEPPVDVGEQRENRLRRLRIERGRRLVAQQQRRIVDERARDADALLLAARQARRIRVAFRREPDEIEQRIDLARTLGLRHAGDLQRQPDVLRDGLGGQQVEMLKHHADPAPQRDEPALVERADVDAVHAHRARRRPLEPVHEPQQRRLARAAAPDHAEHAAARDVERHFAQRGRRPARAVEHLADELE